MRNFANCKGEFNFSVVKSRMEETNLIISPASNLYLFSLLGTFSGVQQGKTQPGQFFQSNNFFVALPSQS